MRNFWVGLVIFIAGAAFLGIGIYVTFFSHRGYVETTARIISVERIDHGTEDDSHIVYVEYTVDGQTYQEKSNAYTSGDKEGKKVKIYYDPEDPSKIVRDGSVIGYISMGCGVLAMLIAIPTAMRKST